MSLAVFEDVSLRFGKKIIVEGLNLQIAEGDRIGLIGPNGSGKSSLLRLLSGQQEVDGGNITVPNSVRIGYLPQDIEVVKGISLLSFMLQGVPGRTKIEQDIEKAEAKLTQVSETADADEMMAAAETVASLHEKLLHFETHFAEHEALKILAGLGFSPEDKDRDLGEFSGGWKMRAVLASLLFQKPDLLLLDEPTNHLDMPSVSWFGKFLQGYKGGFILICHDREFLNEQISRVVSYEPEGVRTYAGNYESYRKQRAEEVAILAARSRNIARERAKTEAFIDRFRAKASKATQVQSRVKKLEKMEEAVSFETARVMNFSFPPCERAGAEIQRVINVGKKYDQHRVFENANLTVKRGDHIGITGVNGAGKTTLLRIMSGEIEPSEGQTELGHNVKLGYYAQHHADTLDPSMTIYETISAQDPKAGQSRVRGILGAFLFSGDDVDKKVSVLSGGERARVALARLMISPGNYLLMDEPTNHLDLESSEALAEALSQYEGTLVFVSHNRSFVRRLAKTIWNVEKGHIDTYPGTLDEYIESCSNRQSDDVAALEAVASAKSISNTRKQKKKESTTSHAPDKEAQSYRKALSQKKPLPDNKAQLRALEDQIATLETQQTKCNQKLQNPKLAQQTHKRDQLIQELQNISSQLAELIQQWEQAQQ